MPIIVGGFYRSGTSLLRRLLDSHTRIHCGPEVKFFKDFYGDFLNDELRHVRLFSTLASLGLDQDELLIIFGAAFIAAHQLAAAKAHKTRWADKNPENVLYLPQWQKLLPHGFLFIHIVRHPLDALASLKEAGFPRAVPADFKDKAKLYLDFHFAAETHIKANPECSIQISYEKLVEEPDRVMSTIFSFVGEKHEASVLAEFYSSSRGIGIEDPKVSLSGIIHKNSIGRWKTDLNSEERKIAKEILAPLLRANS